MGRFTRKCFQLKTRIFFTDILFVYTKTVKTRTKTVKTCTKMAKTRTHENISLQKCFQKWKLSKTQEAKRSSYIPLLERGLNATTVSVSYLQHVYFGPVDKAAFLFKINEKRNKRERLSLFSTTVFIYTFHI